jgi:dehydrogenase with maoC-like domain
MNVFSDFYIGQEATLSKTFVFNEVVAFSELSLDRNPIHLDKEYAKKGIFNDLIVHGLLTSSLISAVIANKLPGPGSIYLSQSLKFLKPVYHNEEVVAKVKIVDIKPEKLIIMLETRCFVNDIIVLDGIAVVKYISL